MQPTLTGYEQARLRLDELVKRYPKLQVCVAAIWAAYEICRDSFRHGGKLLVCGNGGSAADALHFSGELLKGFLKQRPLDPEIRVRLEQWLTPSEQWITQLQGALPALPLTANSVLTTAVVNDQDGELIFAQQVAGYGKVPDSLLAISTSGNSPDVVKAVWVAKAKQLPTIGLTGADGGRLRELCDVCIRVPANLTYEVQELHLPVYHTLASMLEDTFFAE